MNEIGKISYGKQYISQQCISSVIKVLKSDFLTQGPVVSEFEELFSRYVGSKFSVAVNSGTAALHLACLSINLKKNDTLWTVPNSFVASANCALYCGAKVDFVDIDPYTWNISIPKLSEKLKIAKRNNTLPKIIVIVHFSGRPCDLNEIKKLSKTYNFYIVEDACHALGSKFKNKQIGSCQYSDISTFSFHPVKSITTGEGGMIVTNNKKLFDKIKLLRSHGITKDVRQMKNKENNPWYYEQTVLGFNYRMSDIQAALGISQLSLIEKFLLKRKRIASKYFESFKNLPLQLPMQTSDHLSSFHLFVIRVKMKFSKKLFFQLLQKKNIFLQTHYIPIHLQPFYKKMGFKEKDFPESEQFYEEAISLPIYYGLDVEKQNYVIKNIKKLIQDLECKK